ncbi:MAG: tyrosine-type recombinase/integrase [Candidatus Bathyarchaeota archaeon]|nr:tyrosine-type recombinase/integrase [Candidatus Bathyarchaeota archaeon]MDH5746699.1 tyrosine-type recombinase/integrase [Candidatus Bathyarchaeota archaeon]
MTLNWENDRYLRRWLGEKKESTRRPYKTCFKLYLEFTGMTPEQLIMEKWNDTRKPPHEQTDEAEHRVVAFFRWLKNEYKKPEELAKNGDRELSEKSANAYVCAIRGFYAANKVKLNFQGFERGLFSAVTKNGTVKMNPEQIEKLAYYAKFIRDKALIWLLFQSGLDISVALGLNWRDIRNEFLNPVMVSEYPTVLISVTREKAGHHPYETYMGKTAIETLRHYLVERFGEDFAEKMSSDEPLFVNAVGINAGKRLDDEAFQEVMRTIAKKCGIVSKQDLEEANRNPLSPRALRASFQSQLFKVAGKDSKLVDYWAGHKVKYDKAYIDADRETYAKFAMQVLEPMKVSPEIEGKIATQDKNVAYLLSENRRMKERLETLQQAMKPFTELYNGIVEVFGEERATEELKLLFLGNLQAVKEQRGKEWTEQA